MKNTVFVLLIFFLCGIAVAQNKVFFNRISVNEGLSHSDVNAIMQDKDGFMWFGTFNGLCRYDGKDISIYRTDNSGLSNNRVLSLFLGADSLLYIGTEAGGLNYYDPSSGNIKQIKSQNNVNSQQQSIQTIIADQDNKIWFSSDNELYFLTKTNKEIESVLLSKLSLNENIRTITEINRQQILIGTNRGLVLYDIPKRKYTTLLRDDFAQHVNVLKHKSKDEILVGSSEGLYVYHIANRILDKKSSIGVLSLHLDRLNNIWAGTTNDGLYLFDTAVRFKRAFRSDLAVQNAISGNSIKALFDDYSGVLWIGTINEGISMTNVVDKKIELYALDSRKNNSYVQNNVITFLEDNNHLLWIGSRAEGLSVMNLNDRQSKKINEVGSTKLKDVSAFYQDQFGAMWIGTWQGLYLVSPNNVKQVWNNAQIEIKIFNDELSKSKTSIYKIIKDKDNHLWFSTSNGLYEYVPSTGDFYKGTFKQYCHDEHNDHSIQDNFVTDLFCDVQQPNKTIWVGTRRGASRITFSEGKPIIKRIPLSSDTKKHGEFVSVIHQDKSRQIWIATLGAGIHKILKPTDRDQFQIVTYNNKTHAFPNNELESLLEDQHGNFWIGGMGICKFNPVTGEIKHYSNKDRLQSNSFKMMSATLLRSGEMLFGGINGFNIFHPDSLQNNPIPPKIVLTGLKIFSEEVSVGERVNGHVILEKPISKTQKIRLPYNSNSLTFEFVALHFTSPAFNQYKYKLEGFDNTFHFTKGTQNFAVYSNLKHGKYKLIVYAANSDGVWSELPATLDLEITPPFWLTIWAYFFYVVLIGFLLFLFRRISLNRLANQHKLEMERQLREEEQKTFDNKIKFFTDISHEIKTPLSLIAVPVDELLTNTNIGKTTRDKLDLINRNVGRLTTLVDQILDFRKFESNMMSMEVSEVNIKDFLQELVLLFKPIAEAKNVELNLVLENIHQTIFIDSDKMEKVIMNLLSNALKFSPANGRIDVFCSDDAHSYIFQVIDNGPGIHEHELNKIFEPFYQSENNDLSGGVGIGLSLSKYIIDQHHGEIWAESPAGRGTTFYVRLAKGTHHLQDNLKTTTYITAQTEPMPLVVDQLNPDEELFVEKYDDVFDKEATIVLIEDNFEFGNYVTQLLSPKYHTILINDSTQAFIRIKEEQPDLVITDVMMPELTGVEICTQLKGSTETSHIPVMMLTARNLLTHKIDGYNTGADAYMSKPFNLQLFKARVDSLVQSSMRLKNRFSEPVNLEPSQIVISTYDQKMLNKCLEIIEANMHDPDFGVQELSQYIAISRPQLYRKIKALTGMTAVQFIRNIRLKRAAQILENDNYSVSDVMYKIGINNLSYFSKIFKEEFGCLPKQYLNKHKGS